ncbi:MAG: alpha/beta fold hydrolase [Gammaproteobacteria bacterium]|nr:alpha/beta fold hydrolase [Gammaproteobacteria bacterium]
MTADLPLLHHVVSGQGEPLLVLHGLFGSGKNWQSHARRIAEHFSIHVVDLRNHGDSFHAEDMSYPAMAADVQRLIETLGIEGCRVLGHSMGGKVAMTLAARYPGLVSQLVVADIAPVSYFHDYDDLLDPVLALPLAELQSRAQADLALRENIPEDPLRAFLLQNLQRDAGGWRWRVNWRVIQREMESLTGFESLAGWQIDLPTLFIRGARSDYVGDAELEVIQRHFSRAEIATVDDAGHWLHAEQPEAFVGAVLEFLRRS